MRCIFMTKNKKLEILYIHDIRSMDNPIFSKKTNHYLQNLLFNLRVLFRYNKEDLDDLIELYYYIKDLLNNKIEINDEELKLLIYRLTDIILNIEQYNIRGETIITETIANLQQSLYLELECFKLADKRHEDNEWKNIIELQIKDTQIEFNTLIEILEENDTDKIKENIQQLLQDNYQLEYATYLARKNYLEY